MWLVASTVGLGWIDFWMRRFCRKLLGVLDCFFLFLELCILLFLEAIKKCTENMKPECWKRLEVWAGSIMPRLLVYRTTSKILLRWPWRLLLPSSCIVPIAVSLQTWGMWPWKLLSKWQKWVSKMSGNCVTSGARMSKRTSPAPYF